MRFDLAFKQIAEVQRIGPSCEVRWPGHKHPSNCSIRVRNNLDIDASRQVVWAWLTHATLWPTWYENAENVCILDGSAVGLEIGSTFRWKIMGITVKCMVVEYIINERLAWSGRAYGIDVYHSWVLAPLTSGCSVITEETQRCLLGS
ncbi:MAG: hypothetical protein ACI90U_002620 [Pseudomonadales bacterium]